jgi:hypothetical protein
LINEDVLPSVSAQFEASEFLMTVARLCSTPEDQEPLSDLEDRCIHGMTACWEDRGGGFHSTDSLKKLFTRPPVRALLALLASLQRT